MASVNDPNEIGLTPSERATYRIGKRLAEIWRQDRPFRHARAASQKGE
jgi:hypothetical protein